MTRKTIKFCQGSASAPRNSSKTPALNSKNNLPSRCPHLRPQPILKVQTHHKIQMTKKRKSKTILWLSSPSWRTIHTKIPLRKFNHFYQLYRKALLNSFLAPKLHHVRFRPITRVSTSRLRRSNPSTFNNRLSLTKKVNKYKSRYLTRLLFLRLGPCSTLLTKSIT